MADTAITALDALLSLVDGDRALILKADDSANGLATVATMRSALFAQPLTTASTRATWGVEPVTNDPLVADAFKFYAESSAFIGDEERNDYIAGFGFNPDDDTAAQLLVQMESYYKPYAEQGAVMEYIIRAQGEDAAWTLRPLQINTAIADGFTQVWLRASNLSWRTHDDVELMSTAFNGVTPTVIDFGIDIDARAQLFASNPMDGAAAIEVRQPATITAAGDNGTRVGIAIRNQNPVSGGGYALNTNTPIIALNIEPQLATNALSIKATNKAVFSGGLQVTDVDGAFFVSFALWNEVRVLLGAVPFIVPLVITGKRTL